MFQRFFASQRLSEPDEGLRMARKLSTRTRLYRQLSSSSLPIFIVDQERQIEYGNPAFLSWIGLAEEQLVGLRCDYHSHPQGRPEMEIATALCPPPETFAGRLRQAEIRLPGATADPRPALYIPLGEDAETTGGVLVCVRTTFDLDGQDATPNPFEPEQLHIQLQELRDARRRGFGANHLIGVSPSMQRVREQARLAASGGARVLIVGPPGSGREHIARTIHQAVPERDRLPLIPVACDLLDADLVEAALQSATHDEDGNAGGTLLLLDVEHLSPPAQTLLATRLSSDPDFHALSTSAVPLVALALQGVYRTDLAYALSTLTLDVPPVAARKEDIPLLAQLFLEEQNALGGPQLSGLTDEALELLVAYDWPGNIDELAVTIAQSCIRCRGPLLGSEDLPEQIRLFSKLASRPKKVAEPIDLDAFLEQVERELLERALRASKGNKSQAAKLLGVTRARLHRRLTQLGESPASDPLD